MGLKLTFNALILAMVFPSISMQISVLFILPMQTTTEAIIMSLLHKLNTDEDVVVDRQDSTKKYVRMNTRLTMI